MNVSGEKLVGGGGGPEVQRQGLWIFFFKSKRAMKVSEEETDKGQGRALEICWDYRLWISGRWAK